jgi:hypothetical protein
MNDDLHTAFVVILLAACLGTLGWRYGSKSLTALDTIGIILTGFVAHDVFWLAWGQWVSLSSPWRYSIMYWP